MFHIDGWGLTPDDEGEASWMEDGEGWKHEQSYPSGLETLSKRMTDEEAKSFTREYREAMPNTRIWRRNKGKSFQYSQGQDTLYHDGI